MRRQEVSFPLAFRLFLPAHLHRTIRAVFSPVGVGSKRRPADGAAFDFVPAFGDLGAQGRVQRQDGYLEPPAQQRIGNHLHAHAALAVVQRQAVAAIIVGAQPPDQPVAACPLGGRQALDLIQLSSPPSPSHS